MVVYNTATKELKNSMRGTMKYIELNANKQQAKMSTQCRYNGRPSCHWGTFTPNFCFVVRSLYLTDNRQTDGQDP